MFTIATFFIIQFQIYSQKKGLFCLISCNVYHLNALNDSSFKLFILKFISCCLCIRIIGEKYSPFVMTCGRWNKNDFTYVCENTFSSLACHENKFCSILSQQNLESEIGCEVLQSNFLQTLQMYFSVCKIVYVPIFHVRRWVKII